MVTNSNQTYFGDHFAMYTNIQSLCCTDETNIMLHFKIHFNKKELKKKKSHQNKET